MGNWKYNLTHCKPRHWMEVSGQLHAPAALTPEKEPPRTVYMGDCVGIRVDLDAVA